MSVTVIISILFRLINFGILIAAFIYIYKKYIHSALVNGMQHERDLLKKLEHKKKDISLKSKHLSQQLINDKEIIHDLSNKIEVWSRNETASKDERELYKKLFLEKLKKQAHFKQLRIAEYMLEKESIEAIIENTKEQLIKELDHKQATEYMRSIIKSLSKKSVSS